MEFITQEDVIKQYAQNRKALDEDDVRDLYKTFIGYVKKELSVLGSNEEFAFNIDNFGTLFEPTFDTRALLKPHHNKERKRTEKKLAEFIFTGAVKPIIFNIKNDKILRI